MELISTASSLIEATFEILNMPHLFDVGVDACLELIRTYWDSSVPGNVPIIHLVVPAVMNQVEHLKKANLTVVILLLI